MSLPPVRAAGSALVAPVLTGGIRSCASQTGVARLTSSHWRHLERTENLNLPALVAPTSSSARLLTRPRATEARTSSFRCTAAVPTLPSAHASVPSRRSGRALHKPRPSCPAGSRAMRDPAPSRRASRCPARESSSLALGSSLLLIFCFARVCRPSRRRCSSSSTSLIFIFLTLSKVQVAPCALAAAAVPSPPPSPLPRRRLPRRRPVATITPTAPPPAPPPHLPSTAPPTTIRHRPPPTAVDRRYRHHCRRHLHRHLSRHHPPAPSRSPPPSATVTRGTVCPPSLAQVACGQAVAKRHGAAARQRRRHTAAAAAHGSGNRP